MGLFFFFKKESYEGCLAALCVAGCSSRRTHRQLPWLYKRMPTDATKRLLYIIRRNNTLDVSGLHNKMQTCTKLLRRWYLQALPVRLVHQLDAANEYIPLICKGQSHEWIWWKGNLCLPPKLPRRHVLSRGQIWPVHRLLKWRNLQLQNHHSLRQVRRISPWPDSVA